MVELIILCQQMNVFQFDILLGWGYIDSPIGYRTSLFAGMYGETRFTLRCFSNLKTTNDKYEIVSAYNRVSIIISIQIIYQ